MWSLWSASSDLEYYDSLGADRDEGEPEICGDCGAPCDLDHKQQERLDSIQERIEELDSREPVWPPETLAIAGAVVTLGGNGKAVVERGFIRPEDAPAEEVGAGPQANGATAKTEKSIHSASLLESLTAHRSAALTAALTQQRDVALAASVHALASQVFYNDRNEGVAVQISARVRLAGGSRRFAGRHVYRLSARTRERTPSLRCGSVVRLVSQTRQRNPPRPAGFLRSADRQRHTRQGRLEC